MRKHIALALVTAMPLSLLAGTGSSVLQSFDTVSQRLPNIISLHNVDHLYGAALGVYKDLKLHGQTQDIGNLCSICYAERGANGCEDASHTKKVAAFYGSQFIEGIFFGAQNYLILHHLYNQGPIAAGTQLGINALSAQAINLLLKPAEQEPQIIGLARQAASALVKRGAKLGLGTTGIGSDIVFEPQKMRSFFKGTLINQVEDISLDALKRLNAKLGNAHYAQISQAKRREHPTLVVKSVGVITGAYLARWLLEEKLDDLVQFLTYRVKDHAPELISKLVSLTK